MGGADGCAARGRKALEVSGLRRALCERRWTGAAVSGAVADNAWSSVHMALAAVRDCLFLGKHVRIRVANTVCRMC